MLQRSLLFFTRGEGAEGGRRGWARARNWNYNARRMARRQRGGSSSSAHRELLNQRVNIMSPWSHHFFEKSNGPEVVVPKPS